MGRRASGQVGAGDGGAESPRRAGGHSGEVLDEGVDHRRIHRCHRQQARRRRSARLVRRHRPLRRRRRGPDQDARTLQEVSRSRGRRGHVESDRGERPWGRRGAQHRRQRDGSSSVSSERPSTTGAASIAATMISFRSGSSTGPSDALCTRRSRRATPLGSDPLCREPHVRKPGGRSGPWNPTPSGGSPSTTTPRSCRDSAGPCGSATSARRKRPISCIRRLGSSARGHARVDGRATEACAKPRRTAAGLGAR